MKLIAAGEDVRQPDRVGNSPLHAAISREYFEVAQELLLRGADLNATNQVGATPLHQAIMERSQESVKFLVSRKPDMRMRYNNLTPLHLALSKGADEIALILIGPREEGHSFEDNPLEIPDAEENRPLHCAVSNGMLAVVDKLLFVGCQINSTNKRGNTPLHEAVLSGDLKHIAKRIRFGGDQKLIAQRMLHNGTAELIVKILLLSGADVNVCNQDEDSPLHSAAQAGSTEIVKLLTHLPKLVPFSDANTAQQRLMTALLCFQRYAHLPREIIFKIFTLNNGIAKEFALVLLRSKTNIGNRSETTITNTSQWRLLIKFTIDGRSGTTVLVHHDIVTLPGNPKQISHFTASTYGKLWANTEWSNLNLLTYLYKEATKNPDKNIELQIDGGDKGLREFTRPFTVTPASHDSKNYEPFSRVPRGHKNNIIGAFPCLFYKVIRGEKKEADILADIVTGVDDRPRLILQLPQDATVEALELAHEFLVSLWEREFILNPKNSSYVRMVLANISAAYISIKEQKPFQFYFPIERTTPEQVQPNMNNLLALKFFNKKNCSEHNSVLLFTELCITMDLEALQRRNGEGKTAYQCACDNGDFDCPQLLYDASFEIYSKRREWYYKLMRRLLYGTYDIRVVDGRRNNHISNRSILTPALFGSSMALGFAASLGPVGPLAACASWMWLTFVLDQI